MNAGRMVFSQLIGFLPDRDFRRCVQHYNGDLRHREGGFSCWDQFLCMAFAQLTLLTARACVTSKPACDPRPPSFTIWVSVAGFPSPPWPTLTSDTTGASSPTSRRLSYAAPARFTWMIPSARNFD